VNADREQNQKYETPHNKDVFKDSTNDISRGRRCEAIPTTMQKYEKKTEPHHSDIKKAATTAHNKRKANPLIKKSRKQQLSEDAPNTICLSWKHLPQCDCGIRF